MKNKKIIKIIVCIISIVTILATMVISTFADALEGYPMDQININPSKVDYYLNNATVQIEYNIYNQEDPTAYNIFTLTRQLEKPTTPILSLPFETIQNGIFGYREVVNDRLTQVDGLTILELDTDPVTSKTEDFLVEGILTSKMKIKMENVYITNENFNQNKFPSIEIYIPNGVTSNTAINQIARAISVNATYSRYYGLKTEDNSKISWTETNDFPYSNDAWEIETNWDAKTRIAQFKIKPKSRPSNIILVEDYSNPTIEDKITEKRTDVTKFNSIEINLDFKSNNIPRGVIKTGWFYDYNGNEYFNIGQNIIPTINSYYANYSDLKAIEEQYSNEIIENIETISVTIKEEIAINGFTQWLADVIDPIMQFNIGGIKIIDIVGILIAIAIFIIILKVFAGG